MTLEKQIAALLLSLGLINAVTGSSYSNVYVESQTYPQRRISYAAPYTAVASPQIAEINSLPSNIPAYVACVSPCPVPEQTVTAINPNPSVLRLNSQPYATVPVVVSPVPKEDTTGYEYSYAVYDDSTGDHKAQRELSDGSVVQGEYSFLQPDGLVREVSYVADDIKGFNAVVKNFLPFALKGRKRYDVKETTEPTPPSNEVKKESLKEAIKESEDISEIQVVVNSQDPEIAPVDQPVDTEIKKKPGIEQENNNDAERIQTPELTQVPELNNKNNLEIVSNDILKKPKEFYEEPKNNSDIKSKAKPSSDLQKIPKENPEKPSGEKNTGADAKPFIDNTPKGAELQVTGEHHITNMMTPLKERDVLVPYSDIVRCVQAALKKANGYSANISEEPSPLTYIVFNKPC